MNDPDKRLLLRIKDGDRKAFDRLFEEHFEELCKYAFSLVREKSAAEEIVTEVFYRIWCKRNKIQIKVSAKRYLLKSVYNVSLNYLKHIGVVKKYRDLNIVMLKEQEVFSDNYNSSPLVMLEYGELEALVNDIIDNLPDQCGKVFTMNRFEGMKYREIADALGISLSTVKYHMSTALDRLHDKLNGYLDR
ncbi:MAG: RNA polymerase sigma-70 factor [Bacteroidota bacterium]